MNQEEEDEFELIEAFILGKMEGMALKDFEERVKNDMQLSQKVDDYRLITQEVQSLEQNNFLDQVKNWDTEGSITPPSINKNKKVFSITPYLSVAAAITILVVAGWWFFKPLTPTTGNMALYNEQFYAYDDIISKRSATIEGQNQFKKGLKAYNQPNYPLAIQSFQNFLLEQPGHTAAKFYLAMSLMGNHQVAKAKPYLLEIVNSKDPVFKEIADWYLVLTYLWLQEDDQLNKQLALIKENKNHMFYQKAAELKTKLTQ